MDMFSVNIEGVQTNMVYIEINEDLNANQVVEKLAEHDVHVLALGDNLLSIAIFISQMNINKSVNAFVFLLEIIIDVIKIVIIVGITKMWKTYYLHQLFVHCLGR